MRLSYKSFPLLPAPTPGCTIDVDPPAVAATTEDGTVAPTAQDDPDDPLPVEGCSDADWDNSVLCDGSVLSCFCDLARCKVEQTANDESSAALKYSSPPELDTPPAPVVVLMRQLLSSRPPPPLPRNDDSGRYKRCQRGGDGEYRDQHNLPAAEAVCIPSDTYTARQVSAGNCVPQLLLRMVMVVLHIAANATYDCGSLHGNFISHDVPLYPTGHSHRKLDDDDDDDEEDGAPAPFGGVSMHVPWWQGFSAHVIASRSQCVPIQPLVQ
uniref:Uncharacterized protein n=1 Tax=Anopheles atroparvus TaxID=41427 RepID=A0A182JEE1_ANOAO